MELIKQLAEAKAQGLNKEEFFHLLEIEVKLNESKKQYPSVSGDIPVTSASGDDFTRLEKVLQDVSSKLNSQQQQLSEVHQSLGELHKQQRQQSQPLQHLQQQQQGQLQKQQQEVQQLIHQQLQQHQQHVQQHLQQQLQQHQQLTQQMLQKQEQHQQQVQQLLQQQEQHLQYQHQIQNQQLQQHVQQIQQHLQQWQTHQLPQSMHQQPQQPQLQQQQQFQQQLENALCEITEQFKQQDKTLDQKHQHIKDDFHEMRSTVLNKLEEEKIYMKDELNRAQNELLASLSKLGELVGQVREKVGIDACASIENQIAQLLCFGEQQRTAQEKQEKRDGEIKDMLKSLFTVQENLSHKCLVPATAKVQKTETPAEMEVKELVKDLKTEVHDTRKDLLAVIGTEAQLVRDQIAASYRPGPRKQQVFDFYVENFEQHINSGQDVIRIESLSVFIDHFQSVLKGSVVLVKGDSMEVWILYARNPRKFGLQIRAGVKVNIRSAVKDLSGKLRDIVIGTEKCTLDENVIKDNEDNWGVKIGTVKCADIIDKGYNKLYQSGAILIRFNIDAL